MKNDAGRPSSRLVLAQWVRKELEDETSVTIPSLRDKAKSHFKKQQPFLDVLLDELLDTTLYDIIQRVVASTRTLVVLGDDVTTRDDVAARAAVKASTWTTWLEHCNGRHFRLMDMGRAELLAAASERESRAKHEMGLATLWRRLAEKLTGSETVSTRFTAEDIEAMRLQIAIEQGVCAAVAAPV